MAQPKKDNKASYFSHDSNARNSDKLIRLRMKHKAAGYGVYFMILERLREEPNYMSVKDYNMIAFDLREDASLIKSVVEDFGLFAFTDDGKCFYSESFNRRMAVKDEKARRQSEAGRKAMQRRWGKCLVEDKTNGTEKSDTPLQEANNSVTRNENPKENTSDLGENDNLVISDLGENDNKKSKVKESKEKKIIKETNTQTNTRAESEKSLEVKCVGVFNFFNEMAEYYKSAIRPVKVLTDERRRKIEAVIGRFSSKQIALAISNAMQSDYLNGRTKRRNRPADFDWIFDEANFVRIFEGNV